MDGVLTEFRSQVTGQAPFPTAEAWLFFFIAVKIIKFAERMTLYMKKYMSILAALALLFSGAACTPENNTETDENTATPYVVVAGEAVDLGLSVKWSSWNLGATAPEEYGDYFAWGEVEPKETYDWSTYKWCGGSESTLTKYNHNSAYGTVDNKAELYPEDDAAHVALGGTWRMPTQEELDELMGKCTWEWTTQNGVNGYKVTGSNGNSIFLPAAGTRYASSINFAGTYGDYWSSSIDLDRSPYAVIIYSTSDYAGSSGGLRYNGLSIRPVTE